MSKVELKHVNKMYGDSKAVDDFNLVIDDKEFIIFVGPSGCGKSTTLRMIAGLEEISSGDLFMDGQKMSHVSSSDRDIAMVFQNYALYPHMTVRQNIAYSLKIRGMSKEVIAEKVAEVAKLLKLEPYLDRKPGQLSGGQKQRVAMGRAMVRHPKVFLMDEPLSNLDAKLRGEMRIEIANLYQKLDATFIYVTHDQTEAMTLGTRIVVMKDGKIQQIDTPKNLFEHPANLFVAGFIGTPPMNFLDATLDKERDRVYLQTNHHEQEISLAKAQEFEENGAFGKNLVLGIRPNDVIISQTMTPSSLTGKVQVYEMLGEDAIVHVRLEESRQMVIVKSPSTYSYQVGDSVYLTFPEDRLYLFDKATEVALIN
ncbi:ABC transporter ATP-binding protein [Streptococcus uberis]|uniref:ABC transporter ATP-binding protein n=1 Tax=Streptococcus uberis TaxID=1349 RepID=UPI0027DE98D7|nr:ABC transporter ATP-binding protein [Streptococcus uberis]MCK1160405.1 ABC transporter ATP-binding protein [Streptococcus uberis]MCK1253715.1 ABC transporter ATP-binding protein [Streptococcus uberis]